MTLDWAEPSGYYCTPPPPRIYDSQLQQQKIMHSCNYISPAAWRSYVCVQGCVLWCMICVLNPPPTPRSWCLVPLNISECSISSSKSPFFGTCHVFVKGENFCGEDLCNAASSLMRPAGIRAPQGQFPVEGLSDSTGGWIAFWNP